jgi:hypothetical protein
MELINQLIQDSDIVFEESLGGVPISLVSLEDMRALVKNIVEDIITGLDDSYPPDECIPLEEITAFLSHRYGVEE